MRPLDHGADVTVVSLTKYYDGHNMTTGGALIAKSKEHHDRIALFQNINGNIMTPQVAYYQLQTVKTLPLRVRQQSENAMAIASFLEGHPMVERVCYPGLA